MIKYELKKILGNRFVVFFFLLMFAVNAILSAVSVMSIPASPRESYPRRAHRRS